METTNLNKTISEIFQDKYIIPLYQRNFAWKENEITQLLQDVYEAYKKNKDGLYYLGTLVVLKRRDGIFEVIDGQQRLTVLALISKILNINNTSKLFYDSRPEVEEFFTLFYADKYQSSMNNSAISNLQNAINYIKDAKLDASNDNSPFIALDDWNDKVAFTKYFKENVILVRVEIPEDIDVATYFEIMNNRGEQLQKHEILKALMILQIEDSNQQKQFAQIWNACSQMDIPIQKLFNAEDRKKYFGENYDSFKFENSTIVEESAISESERTNANVEGYAIDDILQFSKVESKNEDFNLFEDIEDESNYKSIIDFPNFLMHVFKLYYSETEENNSQKEKIPLNEKYLLSVYDQTQKQVNSMEFIKQLLFCRTIFDRFIIKTIDDERSEDGIIWSLAKPKKSMNQTSLRYVNSFEEKQDRIIKALSMLQVTFRTRIYKNWVQDILKWFSDKEQTENIALEHINSTDYSKFLDQLILEYYNERNYNIVRDEPYSEGRKTPHFLFNFIDYLYWIESKNKHGINHIDKVKDFDFKYWNSVEHHYSEQKAKIKDPDNYTNYLDCLGNLCLISKSANSQLSSRDVKEKVESYSQENLGINRQIIYAITKSDNEKKEWEWGEKEIKKHYNELVELLNQRDSILNNSPVSE